MCTGCLSKKIWQLYIESVCKCMTVMFSLLIYPVLRRVFKDEEIKSIASQYITSPQWAFRTDLFIRSMTSRVHVPYEMRLITHKHVRKIIEIDFNNLFIIPKRYSSNRRLRLNVVCRPYEIKIVISVSPYAVGFNAPTTGIRCNSPLRLQRQLNMHIMTLNYRKKSFTRNIFTTRF